MSQKEILIKIAKEEKELYETEKEPPENRGVALRAAEQYLKNAIKMKTKCSVAREAYFCFPDVSSFGFALGVVFGLNSGNTSIIVTETEEDIITKCYSWSSLYQKTTLLIYEQGGFIISCEVSEPHLQHHLRHIPSLRCCPCSYRKACIFLLFPLR